VAQWHTGLTGWHSGREVRSSQSHSGLLGSNIGQVVYSHPQSSQLQETGIQKEFSDWTDLTA